MPFSHVAGIELELFTLPAFELCASLSPPPPHHPWPVALYAHTHTSLLYFTLVCLLQLIKHGQDAVNRAFHSSPYK